MPGLSTEHLPSPVQEVPQQPTELRQRAQRTASGGSPTSPGPVPRGRQGPLAGGFGSSLSLHTMDSGSDSAAGAPTCLPWFAKVRACLQLCPLDTQSGFDQMVAQQQQA